LPIPARLVLNARPDKYQAGRERLGIIGQGLTRGEVRPEEDGRIKEQGIEKRDKESY